MGFGDLIGRPWAVPCNPPETYDCFELCITVRERLGLSTPHHVATDRRLPRDRINLKHPPPHWQRLLTPKRGCIVSMEDGAHVGVYLKVSQVIHCQHGHGVRTDPLYALPPGSIFWELKSNA